MCLYLIMYDIIKFVNFDYLYQSKIALFDFSKELIVKYLIFIFLFACFFELTAALKF